MPPVLGFHFIFTAYGFWLPNDPRGSWSTTIRQYELRRFGDATKVDTHRSLAHDPHDRRLRLVAKGALKHPPVRFTGEQARAIARGFGEAIDEQRYRCHALAVLPDHAHAVIAQHPRSVEAIAQHLKAKATLALSRAGLHPFAPDAKGRRPSPWSRNFCAPFIGTPGHMRQAIRYVEDNPVRAGLPRQWWRCVTAYEG